MDLESCPVEDELNDMTGKTLLRTTGTRCESSLGTVSGFRVGYKRLTRKAITPTPGAMNHISLTARVDIIADHIQLKWLSRILRVIF